MAIVHRMTYEDLLAQPDDGCLHELVRGEIVRMPSPKGDHGHVEAEIVGAISRFLFQRATDLGWHAGLGRTARDRLVGYLASGEAGIRFSLPDDSDQVRGVDVLYLAPEQFERHEAILRTEYIPEVPALVVEVISSSETAAYSNEKVTDYLAGGARLVWQLYPSTRNVRVYQSDGRTWTIAAGGVLDGGDVLPGFSVALVDLFD